MPWRKALQPHTLRVLTAVNAVGNAAYAHAHSETNNEEEIWHGSEMQDVGDAEVYGREVADAWRQSSPQTTGTTPNAHHQSNKHRHSREARSSTTSRTRSSPPRSHESTEAEFNKTEPIKPCEVTEWNGHA